MKMQVKRGEKVPKKFIYWAEYALDNDFLNVEELSYITQRLTDRKLNEYSIKLPIIK